MGAEGLGIAKLLVSVRTNHQLKEAWNSIRILIGWEAGQWELYQLVIGLGQRSVEPMMIEWMFVLGQTLAPFRASTARE